MYACVCVLACVYVCVYTYMRMYMQKGRIASARVQGLDGPPLLFSCTRFYSRISVCIRSFKASELVLFSIH